MKIFNRLNQREIELLNKINIVIEDRDYFSDELENMEDDIVFKGEICHMDKNENPTALSNEYMNLADKFIEFENEAEK